MTNYLLSLRDKLFDKYDDGSQVYFKMLCIDNYLQIWRQIHAFLKSTNSLSLLSNNGVQKYSEEAKIFTDDMM